MKRIRITVCDADARLMAEAPAMLALIQEIIQDWREIGRIEADTVNDLAALVRRIAQGEDVKPLERRIRA